MMAAPAVAAVLALLVALLAPSLHGAHSYDSSPSQRSLALSAPHKQLNSAGNEQFSDEDSAMDGAMDDDLGAARHPKPYTTGHTVLKTPPAQNSIKQYNCSSCMAHEKIRNISKENIKKEILKKLGLEQAPNLYGKVLPKVPEVSRINDDFNMQKDGPHIDSQFSNVYELENAAKVNMIVVIGKTRKLRHGGGIVPDLIIHHFLLSELSLRNTVENASLFVHMPKVHGRMRLLIYKVVGNESEHQSMFVLLHSATTLQHHTQDGWVVLNVKRLVEDWFKMPRNNLGIVIKIEDEKGHARPYSVSPHHSSGESLDPFLEISMADNQKSRSKRGIVGLNCNETSSETKCCRFPLIVDFDEFGWDFIIAPKKFDSNYCSGECIPAFMEEYVNTHIMRQADPTGKTRTTCCSARKLSPVMLLYFDKDLNIVSTILPNMRVEYCGCF